MRNLVILIGILMVTGCTATMDPAIEKDIQLIKSQQIELKAQFTQNEEKLTKMERALENSLKTLIRADETSMVNKKNIAVIYNILKAMLDALKTEKSYQLEKLESISKVTEKMVEQYGEKESPKSRDK